MERGTVEVEAGHVAWAVTGEGEPVLWIQGVGIPGSGWGPQVDGLRDRFRCAIYDNRGLGGTTAPTGGLTIERMASDARAVMDALGWESAHVVGHSMGGLIAQQLALDAPTRVRSLALLSTFARGSQAVRIPLSTMWIGLRTAIGTRRMRRHAAVRLVHPDDWIALRGADALAGELGALFGRDMADAPAVTRLQVAAMGRHDPSPRIAEIAHLPTLVATAEHDRIALPAYTVELARSFRTRPIVLDGMGHACTVQRPDLVNRMLGAHLGAVGD